MMELQQKHGKTTPKKISVRKLSWNQRSVKKLFWKQTKITSLFVETYNVDGIFPQFLKTKHIIKQFLRRVGELHPGKLRPGRWKSHVWGERSSEPNLWFWLPVEYFTNLDICDLRGCPFLSYLLGWGCVRYDCWKKSIIDSKVPAGMGYVISEKSKKKHRSLEIKLDRKGNMQTKAMAIQHCGESESFLWQLFLGGSTTTSTAWNIWTPKRFKNSTFSTSSKKKTWPSSSTFLQSFTFSSCFSSSSSFPRTASSGGRGVTYGK